ncbi:unnamed protein product [Tilletia controversa]|uniref:Uncharacterized protein n=3 Tax=Tilletia TaxID=13289 RepID=A0A8X7SXX9_9BASI|nr:hypothetical protein CF336_g2596 [Tilletia laevis]KAE8202105.1 hypothetical protein CF328_g2410 [Tilletia controversa]KAE8263026.1 hypothetical protein A4X03_0g1989 [Tilletia caries]KAE8206531.1 hypothetical protein CF335_g1817 [Tilletia laevis]KAE8249743.1 hypothetical protein A4X06_0g3088 [Tilletia controversa]
MQFSHFVFLGATVLSAGMVAAQASNGLTVQTLAALTTCIPNRLIWSGGVAPFAVSLIVPGTPTSVLARLGTGITDQFYVYTPDGKTSGILSGDSVAVYVQDAGGFFSASAGFPVVSGGGCANNPSSSAAAGSSSAAASTASSSAVASTTAASTTTTAAAVTSSTSTSTASRSTSTSTSSTAAPTTSAPANAAAPRFNGLTAVVAGAVGVAAAALL